MKKYTSATLADTKKLADAIASGLNGGEVIGLIGNLGAGKTTLTQLLAQALGVKDMVNSPTFNIIKIYPLSFRPNGAAAEREPESRKKIKRFIHIDAYRLNSPEELQALGVAEYFSDPHTVTVIEWADKVKEVLPENTVMIKIILKKSGKRSVAIAHKKINNKPYVSS